MAQPTPSTATATTITKALRQIWPAPITLRTKLVDERTIEVTAGRGCRNQAEGAVASIERATGRPWRVSYIENLRNNIRIIYTVGVPAATFDEIGRPHEWKPGQADEKTVAARRAAVHCQGLRTGMDIKPGELVVHIATAMPGTFVGTIHYDRPFHGLTGDWAGVTWAGSPIGPQPVAPGDVVALADSTDWIGCWITEDDSHADHIDAVTPECLLGDPAAELEGAELVETQPGRWEAADGIVVTREADGTYWAYDENGIPGEVAGHRARSICARQDSLEDTHRSINRHRTAIAEHYAAMYEIVADVDAAITTLAEMRAAYAAAQLAWSEAFQAGRPGNYERKIGHRAQMGVARAELMLAHLLGDRTARVVSIEASYDDGCTWEMFGSRVFRIGDLGRETASEQALRYAIENQWAGPERWRSNPHPLRVRIYTDPAALVADGEWANFTPEPCPAGQHEHGGHRTGCGPARPDGSKVETGVCERCMRKIWRVRPFSPDAIASPWQLEGDPLPDAEPGVLYLPVACLHTRHYGMEINDGFTGWRTLVAAGPVDQATSKVDIYTNAAGVDLRTGPDPHDRDLLDAAFKGHLGWDRERGDRFIYIGDRRHEAVTADDTNRITRLAAEGFLDYDPTKGFTCVTTLQPAWDVLPTQRRANAHVQLRPAPGGGLGPGLDGNHPNPDPDLARDSAAIIKGSGSGSVGTELGYRVSAQTQTGWKVVGSGTLPPIFTAGRSGLDLAAETILGNARPILGLGPQDPMPQITVQTWHRWSGLTACATRTH